MSKLSVNTIAHTSGTTAMTIDNTGVVTTTKELLNPNYMIQQWRVQTDFSTNNSFIKGTGVWEPNDSTAYHGIGNYPSSADMSLDVSTGTFTFPRTGVYLVRFFASIRIENGDTTVKINIYATINGGATDSDYTSQAQCTIGHAGANAWGSAICETLVNVTNTTNVKVRFKTDNFSSGTYIGGSDTQTTSGVIFERKGPSQ